MTKALDNFQNLFLSESKFMFGNEISYADVAAACEIEQPRKYESFQLSYYTRILSKIRYFFWKVSW